jgi:hypothetical protein
VDSFVLGLIKAIIIIKTKIRWALFGSGTLHCFKTLNREQELFAMPVPSKLPKKVKMIQPSLSSSSKSSSDSAKRKDRLRLVKYFHSYKYLPTYIFISFKRYNFFFSVEVHHIMARQLLKKQLIKLKTNGNKLIQ